MALDEHRIAWAGVYGAAGTFLASAGVSVIAAMVANPSPPIWAWFLSAPLLLFGFILLFVAYWSWSRGVNPKPPRDPMPVRDVLSAVDKHFPHLVGAYTYTTAFLQDARNRRHKIWGRIAAPVDWLDEMVGTDRAPLVFIPPDYWATAKIDWLESKSEPRSAADVKTLTLYIDLTLSRGAFSKAIWWDKIRGRFK